MRNRFKMRTSPTVVAVIAVALMLLLILGAGLFRAGGMEIFDDPGSAADWVAAVGTWAVGLAAAWVGWLSHKLQLADRIRRKLEDARMHILRLETIGSSVNNVLYRLDRVLAGIDRFSTEYIDETTLKEATHCAATLAWSREEHYMFSPTTRLLMLRVESLAATLPGSDQQRTEGPFHTSPGDFRRTYINALASLVNSLRKLEVEMRNEVKDASKWYRDLSDQLASDD